MARSEAEERVKIEVPKGLVVTLAISIMTAIGSPWVAKFYAPTPVVTSIDATVTDIDRDVESLKQSRDEQSSLNATLVQEVKAMNATLARMDGRLSAFEMYGWPNSRPPVGGNP